MTHGAVATNDTKNLMTLFQRQFQSPKKPELELNYSKGSTGTVNIDIKYSGDQDVEETVEYCSESSSLTSVKECIEQIYMKCDKVVWMAQEDEKMYICDGESSKEPVQPSDESEQFMQVTKKWRGMEANRTLQVHYSSEDNDGILEVKHISVQVGDDCLVVGYKFGSFTISTFGYEVLVLRDLPVMFDLLDPTSSQVLDYLQQLSKIL